MNYHPILYQTPMVEAIWADLKNQTRRIVKPQPIIDEDSGYVFSGDHMNMFKNDIFHRPWQEGFIELCPYGQVGDVLWCRETWQLACDGDTTGYVYKASESGRDWEKTEDWKWRPSIFMPRVACRLFLLITGVRIERLQDISPGDAANEGVESWNEDYHSESGALHADYRNYLDNKDWFTNPVDSYQSLWEKISGRGSWQENPFVWVINFEKIERPADFLTVK